MRSVHVRHIFVQNECGKQSGVEQDLARWRPIARTLTPAVHARAQRSAGWDAAEAALGPLMSARLHRGWVADVQLVPHGAGAEPSASDMPGDAGQSSAACQEPRSARVGAAGEGGARARDEVGSPGPGGAVPLLLTAGNDGALGVWDLAQARLKHAAGKARPLLPGACRGRASADGLVQRQARCPWLPAEHGSAHAAGRTVSPRLLMPACAQRRPGPAAVEEGGAMRRRAAWPLRPTCMRVRITGHAPTPL